MKQISQHVQGYMNVIGLTGGIGAGKSAVAQILQELGAVVISADRIGHEVYHPGTGGWQAVVSAFGQGVLKTDGQMIDRNKLGALIFANPMDRARLDKILHPRMRVLFQEHLHKLRQCGSAIAVVEAAILIEAGWDSLVDEIWVVTAPHEDRMRRLIKRDALTETEILQRMHAQNTGQQENHSNVIIDNSGDFHQLRTRVQKLWQDKVSRGG